MKSFKRLHITAEGQTEERFVNEALSPHLGNYNISTSVRCVLTSKDKRKNKAYRGGLLSYEKAKKDILTWIKEDKNTDVRFTTMFDLYALPSDFPGFEASKNIKNPYERVSFIESDFEKDINDGRFIAYIQLYEFETLILSKPAELQHEYFEHTREINQLIKLVKEIENPELINDHPETSPSKRILKLIPEYDKVSAGASVAASIGIERLKATCKHFNDWLNKLEHI